MGAEAVYPMDGFEDGCDDIDAAFDAAQAIRVLGEVAFKEADVMAATFLKMGKALDNLLDVYEAQVALPMTDLGEVAFKEADVMAATFLKMGKALDNLLDVYEAQVALPMTDFLLWDMQLEGELDPFAP